MQHPSYTTESTRTNIRGTITIPKFTADISTLYSIHLTIINTVPESFSGLKYVNCNKTSIISSSYTTLQYYLQVIKLLK